MSDKIVAVHRQKLLFKSLLRWTLVVNDTIKAIQLNYSVAFISQFSLTVSGRVKKKNERQQGDNVSKETVSSLQNDLKLLHRSRLIALLRHETQSSSVLVSLCWNYFRLSTMPTSAQEANREMGQRQIETIQNKY